METCEEVVRTLPGSYEERRSTLENSLKKSKIGKHKVERLDFLGFNCEKLHRNVFLMANQFLGEGALQKNKSKPKVERNFGRFSLSASLS